LKALKANLIKKRNDKAFGAIRKKKELWESIRDLDEIAEGRSLAEEERMRKEDMSKELET
jgi:hypothetical protein